jgi:hypothetical protein
MGARELDFTTFFEGQPDDPTDLELLCPPLTKRMVTRAEKKLGHRLPPSFLRLLERRNGGYLARTRFPTRKVPSWASDHVSFSMVYGIGGPQAIDSEEGSRYLIEEWGYPDVGIVISSDGHTAFLLDYSKAAADDEPRVLWVDADQPRANAVLARTFGEFLLKLRR